MFLERLGDGDVPGTVVLSRRLNRETDPVKRLSAPPGRETPERLSRVRLEFQLHDETFSCVYSTLIAWMSSNNAQSLPISLKPLPQSPITM